MDKHSNRGISGSAGAPKDVTLSSMFIRALSLALAPRHLQGTSIAHSQPTRTASFVKRLLSACLSLPPRTTQQVLAFISTLVARDTRLEALFTTEERCNNGRYRGDLDDPQLANPWSTSAYEILVLCERHWDEGVRTEAARLADLIRD